MRRILVEVGMALIVLGLVFIFLGELFSYSAYFPLMVAFIGAALMLIGAAMHYAPGAAVALSYAASALSILAIIILLLGLIGAPLAFISSLSLGAQYAGSYSFSGTLSTETVAFEVENTHSSVSVHAWSRQEYLVNVTVYSYMSIGAKEAVRRPPRLEVEHLKDRTILRLRLPELQFPLTRCDVEVYLPESASVDLTLEVTTGEIEVEHLKLNFASLEATTGSIKLTNVRARELRAETTTGSIRAVLDAEKAVLDTTTGQIKLKILGKVGGEYRLTATTGQIVVDIPGRPDIGVRLVASSNVGSVDYPDNWVKETTGRFIGEEVKAETPNFDSAAIKIYLYAEVTTGQVRVRQG